MRRLAYCGFVLFVAAACTTEVEGPEPRMDDDPEQFATDPSFVCNEAHGEEGSWVVLDGEAFSPLVVDTIATEEDPDVELPSVALTLREGPTGGEVGEQTRFELESPLGEEGGDVRWLDDETLMFRVRDDLQLPEGVYDVEVENPDGQTVTKTEAFGVVPRPQLDAATPEMTCIAQGARTIDLEGENFLVGDDNPQVAVDDQRSEIDGAADCTELHPVYGSYELCGQAEVTVEEDSLSAGTYDVRFENPAPGDCPSRPDADEVTLTIADPPEVHDVEPSPICGEQIDYEAVHIDGEGFITLDGGDALPEVTIGSESYEPEAVENCASVDEAPSMDAEECSRLTVFVEADDLAGDVDDGEFVTDVDVQVDNPEPVGCHSMEDTTVGVTPPPTLTSVEPRAACNNDGTVDYVVEGEHLFEIDGETPEVFIPGGESYDTEVAECTEIEGEDDVRGCEQLEVAIDLEQIGLEGAHTMYAVNPEPAHCQSGDSEQFYAAGPPVIEDADPDGFCDDASFDGELQLEGEFLVDPDGDEQPTVEVGGTEVDYELSDCAPVIDDYELQLCDVIVPEIPQEVTDDLGDEEFEVTVTGAEPTACGSDTFTLHRTEPPTIDSVQPRRVCSAGSSFAVTGTDLHKNAEAYLNGEPAEEVDVDTPDDQDYGTSAQVTFADGLSSGEANFEFVNPGDCGSEFGETIQITDGPEPIFVDPRVVFDQMTTQVTIYAAGLYADLGGEINDVQLVHPDGDATSLDFDIDGDRPSVVHAEIPEDMLDEVDEDDLNDGEQAADFGVRLVDEEIECSNENDDLVTITDETTLALASIDPPFGGVDEETAVEINAVGEDDLDDGEVQFEATPRAYLNPSDGDDSARGREIRALQFIDETELNGIVSGLSVGMYDLIVVNPEGEVGVLADAFEVTEEPAPRVESVSPASWPNDEAALQVDIEGEHFRADPDDPDVEVFCRETGDDETDEDELDEPNSISVDSVSDSEITVSVNTNNLEPLMACYMRVTNPDGTWDEYFPITTTNPAENFVEFDAGEEFDTPRRGPTTLAGEPTRKSRYLYVVGGDDGDEANAFDHGEFSRLNRFGAPVGWQQLPYDLPEGRTLADGVHLDDFVYLVGGTDGDQVSDEVLRARVLDPLDVPEITTIDVSVEDLLDEDDPSDVGGLDAGTYYYRVSAVYTEDDPANPEGESLASEPQPLQLPIDGTEVTIDWEPPEQINHDIEKYRVYRNVEPDDAYGDETLIATVEDGTSFTDEGDVTPGVDTDDEQPLAQGSLGTWHEVSTLNTGRKDAGVTIAPHPQDDDDYFIYVVGGEDGDGDVRSDYEIIDITVEGDREQTVFDATVGNEDLPEAQAQTETVTATGRNASSVAGEPPQIFNIAGTSSNTVYVASVGNDGDLGDWETASNITGGSKLGHAAVAINNNLALVGGHNGNPSTQPMHAEIQCGGGCPPASTDGWVSLSDVNMQDRVTMGDLAFRGFWYLTGGLTDGDVPSNTVDYSVAGATP